MIIFLQVEYISLSRPWYRRPNYFPFLNRNTVTLFLAQAFSFSPYLLFYNDIHERKTETLRISGEISRGSELKTVTSGTHRSVAPLGLWDL